MFLYIVLGINKRRWNLGLITDCEIPLQETL